MTHEDKAHDKVNVRETPATEDLSQAIDQIMERQPNEQVKSIRVFGDNYRCNWWVREKTTHWMSHSGVISKSKFLRVTQNAGKLLIVDLSR